MVLVQATKPIQDASFAIVLAPSCLEAVVASSKPSLRMRRRQLHQARTISLPVRICLPTAVPSAERRSARFVVPCFDVTLARLRCRQRYLDVGSALRVNTLALRKPSPLRIAQPAAAHDASSYAAVSSGRCDSGGSASPAGYVLSACRTPTSLPMKTSATSACTRCSGNVVDTT